MILSPSSTSDCQSTYSGTPRFGEPELAWRLATRVIAGFEATPETVSTRRSHDRRRRRRRRYAAVAGAIHLAFCGGVSEDQRSSPGGSRTPRRWREQHTSLDASCPKRLGARAAHSRIQPARCRRPHKAARRGLSSPPRQGSPAGPPEAFDDVNVTQLEVHEHDNDEPNLVVAFG